MPSYEWLALFGRDFDKLTRDQQKAFLRAVAAFCGDLESGEGFRKGLRVKKMQGHDNLWELTWAPDGRATFHYGDAVKDGRQHIVWCRIGTHEIFRQP